MAWTTPISLGGATSAVVLVPTEAAMVQDLGPFRSGREMETDLLPRSALVAVESAPGLARLEDDGLVRFAFEGNAIRAVNLELFWEKCFCAAGRLATGAPSIAYGRARPEDLLAVARLDLERMVFTDILDKDNLERWAGDRVSSFLPPALAEVREEGAVVKQIVNLPMEPVSTNPPAPMIWRLLDGTLVSLVENHLARHSRDDEALWDITDRLNLTANQHRMIYGGARSAASPPAPF